MSEWRVHLSDRFDLDGVAVAMYRRIGDRTQVIIGFTERGDAIIHDHAEHEAITENLPMFPREVLAAIAEAVKPGPSHAELARVTEALAIERARVDQVLDRRVV